MNILTRIKQLKQQAIGFIRHIRFTQTRVITAGIILLALLLIATLGWDTSLFVQSLAPLEATAIKESKQVSLSSGDIDEAIRILDSRQQGFNTLLQHTAATTTISF